MWNNRTAVCLSHFCWVGPVHILMLLFGEIWSCRPVTVAITCIASSTIALHLSSAVVWLRHQYDCVRQWRWKRQVWQFLCWRWLEVCMFLLTIRISQPGWRLDPSASVQLSYLLARPDIYRSFTYVIQCIICTPNFTIRFWEKKCVLYPRFYGKMFSVTSFLSLNIICNVVCAKCSICFCWQFQECLNELNEVARHRPRLGLIITLAQVCDDDFITLVQKASNTGWCMPLHEYTETTVLQSFSVSSLDIGCCYRNNHFTLSLSCFYCIYIYLCILIYILFLGQLVCLAHVLSYLSYYLYIMSK